MINASVQYTRTRSVKWRRNISLLAVNCWNEDTVITQYGCSKYWKLATNISVRLQAWRSKQSQEFHCIQRQQAIYRSTVSIGSITSFCSEKIQMGASLFFVIRRLTLHDIERCIHMLPVSNVTWVKCYLYKMLPE